MCFNLVSLSLSPLPPPLLFTTTPPSCCSRRAVHLGVAAKVTTLDKTHFAEVERIGILLKNRRTSAAASAAASLAGVKGPDDLPLRPEVRRQAYRIP